MASGRFVLRLPPGLHEALRLAARNAGLSLNEYCVRRLASSPSSLAATAADAVTKALALGGGRVVGLAVFGSWARRELRPESDVDLLVVLPSEVEITRRLYQDWDSAPVRWGSNPVEPHFVHLPAPHEGISGLWAEVAMDGIVLFERDLELSRHLVAVRHRILEGGWVRRVAHGQPYWVEVA
jgi:predicted nucleotidyltransferase